MIDRFENLDHVAEEGETASRYGMDLELRHLLSALGRVERQTGNYHHCRQFPRSLHGILLLSCAHSAVSPHVQRDIRSERPV